MKKITVTISDDDLYAVSDRNVRRWFDRFMKSDSNEIIIATGMQLNELRIGVKQGVINPFTLEFKGETLTVNQNGCLSSWPKGFMDQQDEQLETLLSRRTRAPMALENPCLPHFNQEAS
jgi:hypothetical protein